MDLKTRLLTLTQTSLFIFMNLRTMCYSCLLVGDFRVTDCRLSLPCPFIYPWKCFSNITNVTRTFSLLRLFDSNKPKRQIQDLQNNSNYTEPILFFRHSVTICRNKNFLFICYYFYK